jgi:hypothetical protein
MLMAGEQTAIAEVLAAEGGTIGGGLEPELDLFAAPKTAEGQRKGGQMAPLKGPGRPAGVKNKRTLRDVEILLGTHLDPRAKALWIVEQHPADLAALWHCKVFEAAQEQRLWALGVLPYVAARITPEIIDNRQVIHLHFNPVAEGGAAAASGAIRVLEAADYEVVADIPSAATDANSGG